MIGAEYWAQVRRRVGSRGVTCGRQGDVGAEEDAVADGDGGVVDHGGAGVEPALVADARAPLVGEVDRRLQPGVAEGGEELAGDGGAGLGVGGRGGVEALGEELAAGALGVKLLEAGAEVHVEPT